MRRRWLALAVLAVGAAAAIAGVLLAGGHKTGTRGSRDRVTTAARKASPPLRLIERRLGSLSAPVQDAVGVNIGGHRVLMLGGLTGADVSRAEIDVLDGRSERRAGLLPLAVHDTAVARLGNAAYLFGGGTNAGTQSDAIVQIAAGGRQARQVGRLPAPSSDQSAAVIGDTAYVVGGYTGTRWLDTIVAYRPDAGARVVARLPTGLRYAAVTAAAGKLVIAGGSLPNGTASDAVYAWTPGRKGVSKIGQLPRPTTHAAAATLGTTAFVIGGRAAALDTPTSRIVAVDVASRRTRAAGMLTSPRSDLAAVSLGDTIMLLGGRGASGTEAIRSELVPATGRKSQRTSKPATQSAVNVYAHDGANMLTGPARLARPLVYVPNSESSTVNEIDPRTFKIVRQFKVGALPQHIVPGYDLRTLYVTNDLGNSLTTIDPRTGRPGRTIPVADPYNMYFTPDGRYAIVVAERLHRLDFRDPHTFALRHSLSVPCSGVDHMDFSADGSYLIASCEFSGQLVKVDVAHQRVVGVLTLPNGRGGMPQDVRISPDGRTFYVADLQAGGVWKVNGNRLKVTGFLRTGAGAHGLYPSRDGRLLYVSNRSAGSISVISSNSQKVVQTWTLPGGGSPDMGGVSANGKVLWLSGRYNNQVYAISTTTGHLLARIPVGAGPHGLCVWPQPGRYSLGHTDNMR